MITYAGTFDKGKTFKGGLQWRNCLKWFKGFQVEEERIDVCAASPSVELAQGLIRDQQHTSPPPPTPPPHSRRIFSHYSGADRWAPLCISVMHFLKSEKPIHLGQTQEEGEYKENFKNPLFFFIPFYSAHVSLTCSLCLPFINCLSASPTPQIQPQSRQM